MKTNIIVVLQYHRLQVAKVNYPLLRGLIVVSVRMLLKKKISLLQQHLIILQYYLLKIVMSAQQVLEVVIQKLEEIVKQL